MGTDLEGHLKSHYDTLVKGYQKLLEDVIGERDRLKSELEKIKPLYKFLVKEAKEIIEASGVIEHTDPDQCARECCGCTQLSAGEVFAEILLRLREYDEENSKLLTEVMELRKIREAKLRGLFRSF